MWIMCVAYLLLPRMFLLVPGVVSTTFTITNGCDYEVWPGILSNENSPTIATGFHLQAGDSKILNLPAGWGGRLWGRNNCSSGSDGKFTCLTGDCGSGSVECNGNGAATPTTLAEFKLAGFGGLDYFDVSLVDGYNLPLVIEPQNGTGDRCATTGCEADLNANCPLVLRVTDASGNGVACKSPCVAFNKPQYCCSGTFDNPSYCRPSSYSSYFKQRCQTAYSYAYDDQTSTFTCESASYQITFCPSATPSPSEKTTQQHVTGTVDTTMVFEGVVVSNAYIALATPFLGRPIIGLLAAMAVGSTLSVLSF